MAAEIGGDDLAVIHSNDWRRIVRMPRLPSLILDRAGSGGAARRGGRRDVDGAVTVQIMNLCGRCKRVPAAIKKVDVEKVAKKVASAAVVTCALCGAIVEPPSRASAEPQVPAFAAYSVMWPSPPPDLAFQALGQLTGRSPARQVFLPAGRGDSEPPHSDGPDQTLDGLAADYSGTAPTFRVADFWPQLSAFPDSGGAVPTFTVDTWTSRNWTQLAAGRVHASVLAALPEHAPLQQLPPVILMHAGSRAGLFPVASTATVSRSSVAARMRTVSGTCSGLRGRPMRRALGGRGGTG